MTWHAQWGDKLVSAGAALDRIAPTDHVFTAGLTRDAVYAVPGAGRKPGTPAGAAPQYADFPV